MMKSMLWLSLLTVAAAGLFLGARQTALPHRAEAESAIGSSWIRFSFDPAWQSEDPEQRRAYGVKIGSPWQDGGFLFLNFPEHLEYNPEGATILRHYDKPSAPWIISPDQQQACYRVESKELSGVVVEGFARVASADLCPADCVGVSLAMRIFNGGSITLPVIRPLLCLQYGKLKGFPLDRDHFQHSFIVMESRLTPLADLPTLNPKTQFKGCVVKGCPQRDTRAERQGGLIEKDMDLALSVVTSLDGRKKVILWWTPGKSMIANARIPCIHADPYFGTLKPGETAFAEGLLLFTEADIGPIVRNLAARNQRREAFQVATPALRGN
jgi:hypothetical protein